MFLQVRNWGVGVGCWDRRLWLSDSIDPESARELGTGCGPVWSLGQGGAGRLLPETEA